MPGEQWLRCRERRDRRQRRWPGKDHGAGLRQSHVAPTAAVPRLWRAPPHTPSPGPNRRTSPEELADLPAVSLEGDVPHQNLGGGLLSGDLFLPSGYQGWPAGSGKGSGHLGVGSRCPPPQNWCSSAVQVWGRGGGVSGTVPHLWDCSPSQRPGCSPGSDPETDPPAALPRTPGPQRLGDGRRLLLRAGASGALSGGSSSGYSATRHIPRAHVPRGAAGGVPPGWHSCGAAQDVSTLRRVVPDTPPGGKLHRDPGSPVPGQESGAQLGFRGLATEGRGPGAGWECRACSVPPAGRPGNGGRKGRSPPLPEGSGPGTCQRLDPSLWPSHFSVQARSPTHGHTAPGPEAKASGSKPGRPLLHRSSAPPLDFWGTWADPAGGWPRLGSPAALGAERRKTGQLAGR